MNTVATSKVRWKVRQILKKLERAEPVHVDCHWGGFVSWVVETENITAYGSAYTQIDEYGGHNYDPYEKAIKVSNADVSSLTVFDNDGDPITLNEEEERIVKEAAKALIEYT